MCTIVLLRNVIPGHRLVIAANRDEDFDRPSETPRMQGNGIFAPKDMRRGGSWIGVNRSGLFVGLTNRADIKSERGKTSRGEIVMKALACKTLKEVEKYISGLDTTEFNGFHLVVADNDNTLVFWGDKERILANYSNEEIVAVTNFGTGAETKEHISRIPTPKTLNFTSRVNNILNNWKGIKQGSKRDPMLVSSLLNLHDFEGFTTSKFHGTCINDIENGYGTKSSSLIFLEDNYWQYHFRRRLSNNKHICNAK